MRNIEGFNPIEQNEIGVEDKDLTPEYIKVQSFKQAEDAAKTAVKEKFDLNCLKNNKIEMSGASYAS